MTVEAQNPDGTPIVRSGPYNGNGVTVAFDYDFPVTAETEVKVLRQNADLTEDILEITTDYTVSGAGSPAGGAITLTSAALLPTGTQLVLLLDMPFNQTSDYSNQGRIQLALLEVSLDRLTLICRQLREEMLRAVTVDAFNTTDISTLRTNIAALGLIETEIVAVAGAISSVTTVAGVAASVTTVAGIAAAISTVAGVSAAVSTVATNIASVNTNASNIVAIQGAAGNAASAAADAAAAAASAADALVAAGALTGLAAVATNGLLVRTGVGAYTARSLEVGRGLQVTFADGASGNPKISAEIQWQAAVTVSSGTATTLSAAIPDAINEIFVRFEGVELSTGDSARLRIGPAAGVITSGYAGGAWRGSSYNAFFGGMGIELSGIGRRGSGLYRLVKGSANIWQGVMVGAETVGSALLGAYSNLDVGAALSRIEVNVTGGAFVGGTWQIGWR